MASITFIMSVRPSVRKYQRGSHWTNLREIWLEVFMKICRENPNFINGKERAFYMKIKVCSIVAGNIKLP
jgi:hypothetical protein